MLPPAYVRRLSSDEAKWIQRLQDPDEHNWLRIYDPDRHSKWVRRAIDDVGRGERLAFGCFLRRPNSQTRHGSEDEFVAWVILKRGTYTDKIEMKNFIVSTTRIRSVCQEWDENFDETQIAARVRQKILHQVERFCQRRGFSDVQIELPAIAVSDTGFFLNNGFLIRNLHESRYRRGDYLYTLKKRLPASYAGDPLDFFGLVQWFIRSRYSDNVRWTHQNISGKQLSVVSFMIGLQTADGVLQNSQRHSDGPDDCTIRVVCVVEDDEAENKISDADLAQLSSADSDMVMVFSTGRERRRSNVEARGVKWISEEVLRKYAGKYSEAGHVDMGIAEIGGIALDVGAWAEDLIRAKEGEDLSYVIGSGLGRYACPVTYSLAGPRLALFCSPGGSGSVVEGSEQVVVWGYAEIGEVHMVVPSDIQSLPDNITKDLLWRSEDIQLYLHEYYRSQSEDDKVAVVCLKSANVLKNPLTLAEVFDRWLPLERCDPSDFGTMYFNVVCRDSFLRLVKDRQSAQQPDDQRPQRRQDAGARAMKGVRQALERSQMDEAGAVTSNEISARTAADPLVKEVLKVITDLSTYNPAYDSIEQDRERRRQANRALDILRALQGISGDITDYDKIVGILEKFAQAR